MPNNNNPFQFFAWPIYPNLRDFHAGVRGGPSGRSLVPVREDRGWMRYLPETRTVNGIVKQGEVYEVKLNNSYQRISCLVISPDDWNQQRGTVTIVPLTHKANEGQVKSSIKESENGLGEFNDLAIDQIRAVDKSRLGTYQGNNQIALFNAIERLYMSWGENSPYQSQSKESQPPDQNSLMEVCPKGRCTELDMAQSEKRSLSTTVASGSVMNEANDLFNPGLNNGNDALLFRKDKLIKQAGIYWVNLNKDAIGSELYKTRPCLVISADKDNQQQETVTVVPLTHGNSGQDRLLRLLAPSPENDPRGPGYLALDQIRAVDKKYVHSYTGENREAFRMAIKTLYQVYTAYHTRSDMNNNNIVGILFKHPHLRNLMDKDSILDWHKRIEVIDSLIEEDPAIKSLVEQDIILRNDIEDWFYHHGQSHKDIREIANIIQEPNVRPLVPTILTAADIAGYTYLYQRADILEIANAITEAINKTLAMPEAQLALERRWCTESDIIRREIVPGDIISTLMHERLNSEPVYTARLS